MQKTITYRSPIQSIKKNKSCLFNSVFMTFKSMEFKIKKKNIETNYENYF